MASPPTEVVRGDGQAVVDEGDAPDARRDRAGQIDNGVGAEADGRTVDSGPLLTSGLGNEGQQLRAECRGLGSSQLAVGAEGSDRHGGNVVAGIDAVAEAVAEDAGSLFGKGRQL